LDLSKRRADAARQYLIDNGLDDSTIVATGAGEASPTDSNDTPEGQHNNRRVVIRATR
jgi:OmpA-OmpF porin, OOP family